MSLFSRPPGLMVAREQSPPYREILFDPRTRMFHWEGAEIICVTATFDADGDLATYVHYKCLTPAEIAAHIDDDTMAKCLAMAINPAR